MTTRIAPREWVPLGTSGVLQQHNSAVTLLADEKLPCPHISDDEELFTSKAFETPPIARCRKRQSSNEPNTAVEVNSVVRKPWYAMKKDEMEHLAKEVVRLDGFKRMLQVTAASRAISLLKQQQESEQLRQTIWENQIRHARAESAISDHSTTLRLPFEKTIYLGSSQVGRVATFAELKHRALDDAERYISEQLACLDPRQERCHSSSFMARNGDHCFSGFDVLPLDGFASVHQLFEALHVFYFNMEITWTETSSELMLREGDYESGDQDVAIQRFVRAMPSGAQIESNTALFSRLRKGKRGDDSAAIVVNFVDDDKLFPYRPSERLRQDITAVLTVRAYPKKPSAESPSDNQIVLTRAFFGRLRTNEELEIPLDVIQSVTSGANFWFKTMLKTVGELAKSSSTLKGL